MATAKQISDMISLGINKNAQKKRKTARQQVRDARNIIRDELLAALAGHKRNIPKEWHHGYDSCRTVIEIYFNGK